MPKQLIFSNGSEFDGFFEYWCERCQHDAAYQADTNNEDGCPLLANGLAFNHDHPSYPKEWVEDENGMSKCTAFRAIEKGTPRCPDTGELPL